MAGIYFHIPFCKQACTYCNFHFSTVSKNKDLLIDSMYRELELRKGFFNDEIIDSIYFGGGSPSVLSPKLIGRLIMKAKNIFNISNSAEITLELNPDDSSLEYLEALKANRINRLSIGVQSFIEEDLRLMNRVHSSDQAFNAINDSRSVFENFSIDLIYGLPNSNKEKWTFNLNNALLFNPPHISSYALIVEPKTILKKQVDSGEILLVDESEVERQYHYMIKCLEKKNYNNYEFSSFAKSENYSVNNNGYWKGKPYLGIGPSAHSFDGNNKRSWNISQNNLYIKAIKRNQLPFTEEILSLKDRYNEVVMIGLRTSSGVSLSFIRENIGNKFADYLEENSKKQILSNKLFWEGDNLHVTKKSKFLSDGIASDLFIIDL